MVTIRDVSKLSGCSVATVSRVINKSGYVSADAKQAIQKAIKELNYKPNTIARSLSGKKTYTVGLIIPDIMNPFFPEIARAIEDVASEIGYTVLLCNTDDNLQKEKNYIDVLQTKQVDGIIIASYTIDEQQILNLYQDRFPVVVLDRIFHSSNIPAIVSKNREGSYIAVKHLIDQGCKKIAHIAGPFEVYASRERFVGFEEACKKNTCYLPSLISYQNGFHVSHGFDGMNELLDKDSEIDGVFAGNDLMALGALKALNKRGISVPKDIKLVGFDNTSLSAMTIPSITTIKQPIYEIGKRAMNTLLSIIDGKKVEKYVTELDVELIKRESS
ncbi:LacI family DNA-binding transcriptional regulator [Thalassobacillus devorans]|uniref:LacI family DNA-binding transcriptional regulator n=1 Tax=Thalassobacillus devorans TaxID=279813 RepID=UPI0015947300|nr:LacI family DNA-binding transcriptional regulator [Thalassobacillus devorans]